MFLMMASVSFFIRHPTFLVIPGAIIVHHYGSRILTRRSISAFAKASANTRCEGGLNPGMTNSGMTKTGGLAMTLFSLLEIKII
jgi:hypothetical protein